MKGLEMIFEFFPIKFKFEERKGEELEMLLVKKIYPNLIGKKNKMKDWKFSYREMRLNCDGYILICLYLYVYSFLNPVLDLVGVFISVCWKSRLPEAMPQFLVTNIVNLSFV
ncbi:hypothetical protein CsSME_00010391 [Camellia sinensis var. sinensis]